MNNDPGHDNTSEMSTSPDIGSAEGVSTTEVSAHDAHAGATHEAHDAHGGHGGHGAADDTSDVSTLVPTTFSQLIFPIIILLFVGILVAGPVMNAFATRPSVAPATEQQSSQPASTAVAATPSEGTGASTSTPQALAQPKSTTVAQAIVPTVVEATPTPDAAALLAPTQTAVAAAGAQGDVLRIPVMLDFAGASFTVVEGSGLLPDWKPEQSPSTATWIEGTVANHILYIPFTDQNAALFKSVKEGDTVQLTMNTGQVFSFAITRSDRAANGPVTQQGQFSVATAMAQDHAGVTLFLTGDPAVDRAVVQADFTGNIQ